MKNTKIGLAILAAAFMLVLVSKVMSPPPHVAVKAQASEASTNKNEKPQSQVPQKGTLRVKLSLGN